MGFSPGEQWGRPCPGLQTGDKALSSGKRTRVEGVNGLPTRLRS